MSSLGCVSKVSSVLIVANDTHTLLVVAQRRHLGRSQDLGRTCKAAVRRTTCKVNDRSKATLNFLFVSIRFNNFVARTPTVRFASPISRSPH